MQVEDLLYKEISTNPDLDNGGGGGEMATKKINGKSFQTMGLSRWLMKAVLRKGYKAPTPIQQKCIPAILSSKDVVGMSRTGSGKTGAFIIPMLEKLQCHSAQMGARALVLAPNRELAVQILTYTRDLCKKGKMVSDASSLRMCAMMGGDALEDQFSALAENPDIIVATPGRFLHVLMETGLELRSIQYVVFDEADRLFEMGFEEQLREILHKLPQHRQTLLFSATLPRSLVEFAKAGLTNPSLVRLDSESKISPDLQMSFFLIKPESREAALAYLLKHVIDFSSQSTIVFASTKHHVEYLKELLDFMSLPCTLIHGGLDQEARRLNLQAFRCGRFRIMLVTDVASRGIDIPLLDNVIHYDFPSKVKLFIHRVGRVARAGRPGKSFALLGPDELSYALDLQLHLSRPLVLASSASSTTMIDLNENIVIGEMPQSLLDQYETEGVRFAIRQSATIESLKNVTRNASKMYVRTRGSASNESYARAKEILEGSIGIHPSLNSAIDDPEQDRLRFLGSIKSFRPQETIFEASKKTHADIGNVTMKRFRERATGQINSFRDRKEARVARQASNRVAVAKEEAADENLLKSTFKFKDRENYISYQKQPSRDSSASFQQQAESAIVDFCSMDDGSGGKKLKWNKKRKKYVTVGQIGSDNKKRVKTESGHSIPATYKTDAYARWSKKNKVHLPRVGDQELASEKVKPIVSTIRWKQKYRHNSGTPADKKSGSGGSKSRSGSGGRNELKNKDQILKAKKMAAKRKEKNARPSKKKNRS